MAGFHFNSSSSFEENLKSFLDYMVREDAELGAMLAREAPKLKGAMDDSSRHSARTAFNSAIKKALDEKLAEDKAKTGGSK